MKIQEIRCWCRRVRFIRQGSFWKSILLVRWRRGRLCI